MGATGEPCTKEAQPQAATATSPGGEAGTVPQLHKPTELGLLSPGTGGTPAKNYITRTFYQLTYLKLDCAAPCSQNCSVELELMPIIYCGLYRTTAWRPHAGPHCEKHQTNLIK